jgi:NOL1/NOP2/fmu family ribosome biogenesis protein
MKFPVIELVDRLAIAEVKWQRTRANREELEWYRQQMAEFDQSVILQDMHTLQQIHNEIWELEKELKSGQEHKLGLEEIGRRAIEIRNLNNKRIRLKNQMAKILNCPVREIKKEHASE